MAEKLSRIICENNNSQSAASKRVIQDIQSVLLQLASQNIKPDVSLELETIPEISMPIERKLTLEKTDDVNYNNVIEIASADIAEAEHADKLL